jgi:hypothetical protein
MFIAKHPAFEPTTVQIMADAVDEAWAILEEKANATEQNPQEMKLAIAKRIIELVSQGDYDVQTLRDTAVASLTAPRASPVQH